VRSTLDPTLDVIFKLLFGSASNRDALIDLLTAVLRPRVPIASVEVLNPEVSPEQANDRGIVLDLLVSFEDGTQVDIEMQTTRREGFRNRVLFYWARLYARQLRRGKPYSDLRPVIAVLFLDYVEFETPHFHSEFRVLEVHDHFPFSDALTLHVIELPKRNATAAATPAGDTPSDAGARQGDENLLAWTRFLGAKSDEEVKEACMSNPAIAKTNDLLAQLSATPSAKELARQRQLALDTYHIEMGAAQAAGRAEGRTEGLAEGRTEGLAEGRTEGLAEGRAKGRAEALRAAILTLAEVLSLEVDEARRGQLARATAEELAALLEHLRRARRW
jgi:predicted transposase/invertase (TIGR01784 family)